MEYKSIFKQIFRDHWERFKKNHPAYRDEHYEEIVQKMLGCGEESNGYSEYRCTGCGEGFKRIAFTCKSGFCLSCGKVYAEKVVEQVSRTLHPGVIYRHIVLTVPEQLRQVFYSRRKGGELYTELIRIGHKCLEDVVSIAKRQRLKIGTTIVIHTHGRSGIFNPHIHVIMTDGGMNVQKGKWVELGYFPYDIIHKKWQYHLLTMIKEKTGKGSKGMVEMLWKEYPKGFVANVSEGEVPENTGGLAKYLAKYIASPAISMRRILKYTGTHVTYWYKDHKTKRRKTETVTVERFIGRMVQHILPKGLQRIRYYGLQATKTFQKWYKSIKEGFKKIGKIVKGAYRIIGFRSYRTRYQETNREDPLKCKHCGRIMELWRIWHPKYGLIYDFEGNEKGSKLIGVV